MNVRSSSPASIGVSGSDSSSSGVSSKLMPGILFNMDFILLIHFIVFFFILFQLVIIRRAAAMPRNAGLAKINNILPANLHNTLNRRKNGLNIITHLVTQDFNASQNTFKKLFIPPFFSFFSSSPPAKVIELNAVISSLC